MPRRGDAFLFAIMGYSMASILFRWSSYSDCTKPLQRFLLVSYGTIVVGRAVSLARERANRIAAKRALHMLGLLVVFPFYVSWTVYGYSMAAEHYSCADKNYRWTIVMWLAISTLGSLVYLLLNFFAYYRWRHPLPPREFALDGGARMAEGDNGLTQEEIDVIPTFFGIEDEEITKSEQACSICLDDLISPEELTLLRKLPACGHVFHSKCVSSWLLRKSSCPNCREIVHVPSALLLIPSPRTRPQGNLDVVVGIPVGNVVSSDQRQGGTPVVQGRIIEAAAVTEEGDADTEEPIIINMHIDPGLAQTPPEPTPGV